MSNQQNQVNQSQSVPKTMRQKPIITNALEAYYYTIDRAIDHFDVRHLGLRQVAAQKGGWWEEEKEKQARLTEIYNREKSAWCMEFFVANFPHLTDCYIGRLALGKPLPDGVFCNIVSKF